jgi:hypothetical protein
MPIIGSLGSGSASGFGQRAAAGLPNVTPGNQSFTANGTFTLETGVYYNNLIFRVYGAGGGGSGSRFGDPKYGSVNGPAGGNGGLSSVAKSGITTIQGNGGNGAPENTGHPSTAGSGGTASGGDTNTTGSTGSSGGSGNTGVGGAGGDPGGTGETGYNSSRGGGGQGGGYHIDGQGSQVTNGSSGNGGAGGGGGGFAKKTFSGFEGDGASYTITIGTGGTDGNRNEGDISAPGEGGFVYVEWN